MMPCGRHSGPSAHGRPAGRGYGRCVVHPQKLHRKPNRGLHMHGHLHVPHGGTAARPS